jgi:hypothetical protein
LLRYVLRVEPVASASVEELVHRCAPALAVSLGSAAAEFALHSNSAQRTAYDGSRMH